jgi:transposase
MLIVETIGRIRREHFVKGKSIKEIARDLKISRNTVRRVLRSGETSFSYEREIQPRPKLGRWKAEIDRMLARNADNPARERLTLIRLFEELQALGYEGGYDAVRRYAKSWVREHASLTADAYVPLSFAPGEAYQFDWSHEIVVMSGVTTTSKVAHVRLCHSRMPIVRASGLLSRDAGDGVRRARSGVRLLQGRLPGRASTTIYGRLPRKAICWGRRLECTNLSGLSGILYAGP